MNNKKQKIYSPLITVYITNYNYSKYLKKSINSVISQSYRNFELIIIDDGSTDSSKSIIEKIKSSKIKKKIYNTNVGLNKSNNIAINAANGSYILRLDSDDFLSKDALKEFANHVSQNRKSSLIYPDYYYIDDLGNVIGRVKRENFSKNVKMLDLPAHGACTLFKIETLKKIGGYDEEFNCQDGYDVWLKIINNFKISNINKPLFYYRQHSSSLTKNEEKILFTRALLKKKRVKKLKLNKKDTLAIIPISQNSLDSKVNPFSVIGKKEIISFSINAALKSEYVSKVLLVTDSIKFRKYKKLSSKINLEKRNEKLGENKSLDKLLKDILCKKKYSAFKNAVILFYEYPFRNHIYIDKSIDSLRLFNANTIECVIKENRLIYFHNGKGLKLLKPNKFLKIERDDVFVRTGGVVSFNIKSFIKSGGIYKNKIGHIIIDKKSSFSVNTLHDLSIGEQLLKI